MNTPRARLAQNVITIVIAASGIVCLAIGFGMIRIGGNVVLTYRFVQQHIMLASGPLLASAITSLFWRRWRVLQAKLFFSAMVFAVLLALGEVVARIAGYVPAPEHPSWSFWRPDPELGFACAPNCQFLYLAPEGWVSGMTDSSGFRPTIASNLLSDGPSVICLGDSTTFSCEMADDKTWPEAAARYLEGRGKPCRMLNRGIYGYSGLQSLLMLRRVLKTPGSYRAVVYHFCCNDPIENLDQDVPGPSLEPSGAGFDIKPPNVAPLDTFSAGRFHPEFALIAAFRTWRYSTSGAAYRSGAELNYQMNVGFYHRFFNEQGLRDGERFVFAEMKAECDRHGLPLFVSAVDIPYWDGEGATQANFLSLYQPPNIAQDAHIYNACCDLLRQIVTEAGSEYIDLRGCLEAMTYRDYAASPYDWHFSPKANEHIGTAIARKLEGQIK